MKQIVDERGTRWTLDETEQLQQAVSNNDVEIAKKYLEQGANPNGDKKYDINPLMIATTQGNLKIAKLLIDKGADVNAKDKNGNNALAYCSDCGYAKGVTKLLVENRADINHRDKDGYTALEKATGSSNFEIAKFLIENGAEHKNINESLVIVCGSSNWSWIKSNKDDEFLHYLISHNADVNAKNCIGVSALGNAVSVDNLEFAKFLISNGANVNSKDDNGDTALKYACVKENWELLIYSLTMGLM